MTDDATFAAGFDAGQRDAVENADGEAWAAAHEGAAVKERAAANAAPDEVSQAIALALLWHPAFTDIASVEIRGCVDAIRQSIDQARVKGYLPWTESTNGLPMADFVTATLIPYCVSAEAARAAATRLYELNLLDHPSTQERRP